jgi:hypothetical protein
VCFWIPGNEECFISSSGWLNSECNEKFTISCFEALPCQKNEIKGFRFKVAGRSVLYYFGWLFSSRNPGPTLWFTKYFRRNIWRKYLRYFTQTTPCFFKNLIITLILEEKNYFFTENHNIGPWTSVKARFAHLLCICMTQIKRLLQFINVVFVVFTDNTLVNFYS